MSNEQSYTGSCHCGLVRYEVKLDLSKPVLSCNCSMCARAGTLLAFVGPDAFVQQSGQNALSTYKFNHHVIDHLFCSTCGIKAFARGTTPDGKAMVAINVRCLEGVDLDALNVTKVDGKSRPRVDRPAKDAAALESSRTG